MIARARAPIDRSQQSVLFYVCTDGVSALREHLLAERIAVGEIQDGTPSQEMGIPDPRNCRCGLSR